MNVFLCSRCNNYSIVCALHDQSCRYIRIGMCSPIQDKIINSNIRHNNEKLITDSNVDLTVS